MIINCGALLTGAAPILRSTDGALLTALYRRALYWRRSTDGLPAATSLKSQILKSSTEVTSHTRQWRNLKNSKAQKQRLVQKQTKCLKTYSRHFTQRCKKICCIRQTANVQRGAHVPSLGHRAGRWVYQTTCDTWRTFPAKDHCPLANIHFLSHRRQKAELDWVCTDIILNTEHSSFWPNTACSKWILVACTDSYMPRQRQ